MRDIVPLKFKDTIKLLIRRINGSNRVICELKIYENRIQELQQQTCHQEQVIRELQQQTCRQEQVIRELQQQTYDWLHRIHDLSKEELQNFDFFNKDKETLSVLEEKTIHLITSRVFLTLDIDRKIEIIKKIFTYYTYYLARNGALVADLISLQTTKWLEENLISLPQACLIYDALYGLYWCGAQSIMDMRNFDKNAVKPFLKFLSRSLFRTDNQIPLLQLARTPKKNLRIAYICHYANFERGNAIAPLIETLTKLHSKFDNRDIFIFCVQWSSVEFIERFKDTNITIRNIPAKNNYNCIDEIVDAIRSDNIDVVINDVATSIATYIFVKRVAPIQIWLEMGYPFWSIKYVDWTLLIGKLWQPWFGVPKDYCSSVKIRLKPPDIKSPNAHEVEEVKLSLPNGMKFLAVFTRLIKITSEYLEIIEEILTEETNTHMLIAGAGDAELIKSFFLNSPLSSRITVIESNIDISIYREIIYIFLDTFPFVGGLACREVGTRGIPVVSLISGEWDYLLQYERVPSLLAKSKKEYINIVHRLLHDEVFYFESSQAMRNLVNVQFDEMEPISEIESVIDNFWHM